MATEAVSSSLPLRAAKHNDIHPLAPLTADEIKSAASLIKAQWPADLDLHFKSLTLEEPAKAEMVPYLEAEFHGSNLPKIDRRVFASYYLRKTVSKVYGMGDGSLVD